MTTKPIGDHDDVWLDQPRVQRFIQVILVAICTALLMAEFLYDHHHPHFAIETWFGFQAWLGFGAFVAAVAAGWLLRQIVERPEDYYESSDVPSPVQRRPVASPSDVKADHD